MAFKKAVLNEVINYMATLKAIPRWYSMMSRLLKSCTTLRIILCRFWNNGRSKCSLLVLDWLLSIASPLRFALARKIWRQIFEGFFWRHFSCKQWEILIYTCRSSFPFDTRKINTGFIWKWILTILTKFDGGYFSRFYQSLIKGCTNQCTDWKR